MTSDQNYRPLDRDEIFEVLAHATYCRLGTAENNQPYVIPMYYKWDYDRRGRLWFQLFSAPFGKKMREMEANSNIALEMEQQVRGAIRTVVVQGRVVRFDPPCGYGWRKIEIYAATISGREIHFGPWEGSDLNEEL